MNAKEFRKNQNYNSDHFVKKIGGNPIEIVNNEKIEEFAELYYQYKIKNR